MVDVTGLLEPTIKALKQGGAATLVGMLGGGKELDVVMPLLLGVKTRELLPPGRLLEQLC